MNRHVQALVFCASLFCQSLLASAADIKPENPVAPSVNPWQCDLGYYPSYNKLRVKVASNDRASNAVVSLADAAGKTVWDKTVAMKNGKLDTLLDVPPLEGRYTLFIRSPDGTNTWSYPLERKKFPWEGNTLGITDKVLPPFTPVTVKGQQVGVILRNYTLDGLGLFAQVMSKDAPLLAAPMRLVADGTPVAAGKGAFMEEKDIRAVFAGKAEGTPMVSISNRTTIEYDGCAKIELTLAPRKTTGTLDSLVLEIPLRNEAAPLWHVCREWLRVNIAGKVPAGDGKIWTNRDFNWQNFFGGQTSFRSFFLPYIWLGNEERGLCWFADNDKNWGADPKAEQPY